jgi:hypothetical protein
MKAFHISLQLTPFTPNSHYDVINALVVACDSLLLFGPLDKSR